MKKRLLAILMALSMCTGLLPMTAMAAEEETLQCDEITVSDVELPENDELYAGYLENLFYGANEVSFFGTAAGEALTGDEKVAYDALRPYIEKIAKGERTSTIITLGGDFNIKDPTTEKITTYKKDADITFTETAADFDIKAVVVALMMDMPYEMYWFDKVTGYSSSKGPSEGVMTKLWIRFTVAKDYRGADAYTFNSQMVTAAAAAAENAEAIIAKYKDKSDYEKLVGYRNEICALVSYDTNAAKNNTYTVDHDPWQLINVFDGNDSTNVVCEGYSKAFQYLCDLSTFENAQCYSVTGIMDGGTGAGPHMWNVVTLNSVNYLVDVTNSDAGTVGAAGGLFLAGASGSVTAGYTVAVPNQYSVSYTYNDGTDGTMNIIGLWGEEVLTLAESGYVNAELPAPDLTLVTAKNDPSGLPVGAVYFQNVPASLPECSIEIYDPAGELYDSYYEVPEETGVYYPVKMGTVSETPMTDGTYTIKAKYVQYEEDAEGNILNEIYGTEASLEYEFKHPGVKFTAPTAGWDGKDIQVTLPEDVSKKNDILCQVGYFSEDDGDIPIETSWGYALPTEEGVKEDYAVEMAFLKEVLAEMAQEEWFPTDGVYKYRLRTISDDIVTKYHSDWSDWCEVTVTETEKPSVTVTWESKIPTVTISGDTEGVKVFAALYDTNNRYLGGLVTDEADAYDLSELASHAKINDAAKVKVFAYDSFYAPLCTAAENK